MFLDDLMLDIEPIVVNGPIIKDLMCLEQLGFASAKVSTVGDRDRGEIRLATMTLSRPDVFHEHNTQPGKCSQKLWQFLLVPSATLFVVANFICTHDGTFCAGDTAPFAPTFFATDILQGYRLS